MRKTGCYRPSYEKGHSLTNVMIYKREVLYGCYVSLQYFFTKISEVCFTKTPESDNKNGKPVYNNNGDFCVILRHLFANGSHKSC